MNNNKNWRGAQPDCVNGKLRECIRTIWRVWQAPLVLLSCPPLGSLGLIIVTSVGGMPFSLFSSLFSSSFHSSSSFLFFLRYNSVYTPLGTNEPSCVGSIETCYNFTSNECRRMQDSGFAAHTLSPSYFLSFHFFFSFNFFFSLHIFFSLVIISFFFLFSFLYFCFSYCNDSC